MKDIQRVYEEKAFNYHTLPWVREVGILQWIFQTLSTCDKSVIVDLGCGPGMLGKFERTQGLRYIGVDFSPQMLKRAKKNLRQREQCDLIQKPIKDFRMGDLGLTNDQPIFVLKNVIHLLGDPHKELANLLYQNGSVAAIVLVETTSPNEACLKWVKDLFKTMEVDHKKYWFTKRTFVKFTNEIIPKTMVKKRKTFEQRLNVFQWLESFNLSGVERDNAITFVKNAPKKIKKAMHIRGTGNQLGMLRLQTVIIAEP